MHRYNIIQLYIVHNTFICTNKHGTYYLLCQMKDGPPLHYKYCGATSSNYDDD